MIATKMRPGSIQKVQRRVEPDTLILFGLFLVAVFAMLPSIPSLYRVPDNDSGVFLYMGSRILHGAVPYKDIWDHNPPLIFFLNAAGLLFGGSGRWGVWLLELLAVGGTGVMMFRLLRRYFGRLAAALGVIALLANLFFVNEYGNLPEEYGLPLQAGIFLLLAQALSDRSSGWRPLLIGVLVGLSFSLKHTLIASGLIAGLFLIIAAAAERNTGRLVDLLKMAAGVLAVWLVWVGYFASQQALPAFWDQAFLYNLAYSGTTNPERVHAVIFILGNLYKASGFFALGLVIWLAVLPFLLITEDRLREVLLSRWMGFPVLALSGFVLFRGLVDGRTGTFYALSAMSLYRVSLAAAGLVAFVLALLMLTGVVQRFGRGMMRRMDRVECPGLLLPLGIALVDLPLECLLSGFSGREYSHYFIPLLPSLAILTAWLAWSILSIRGNSPARYDSLAWVTILTLVILVPGVRATFQAVQTHGSRPVEEAVQVIDRETKADDLILQWGDNGRVYFLASRPAGSRFISQQALFTPGYTEQGKIDLLLEDLQQNRPAFIVDTRLPTTPLVYSGREECNNLDSTEYVTGLVRADRDTRTPWLKDTPLPYVPAEMKRVYRWICEQYEPVLTENATQETWRMYRLREMQP